MALYLNEVWVKDPNPERVKEFFNVMSSAIESPASLGAPLQGAHIVAGPWASNEEAKVLFIFDVPDHTPTFQIFGKSERPTPRASP